MWIGVWRKLKIRGLMTVLDEVVIGPCPSWARLEDSINRYL